MIKKVFKIIICACLLIAFVKVNQPTYHFSNFHSAITYITKDASKYATEFD